MFSAVVVLCETIMQPECELRVGVRHKHACTQSRGAPVRPWISATAGQAHRTRRDPARTLRARFTLAPHRTRLSHRPHACENRAAVVSGWFPAPLVVRNTRGGHAHPAPVPRLPSPSFPLFSPPCSCPRVSLCVCCCGGCCCCCCVHVLLPLRRFRAAPRHTPTTHTQAQRITQWEAQRCRRAETERTCVVQTTVH
jgi:hypothetical protein